MDPRSSEEILADELPTPDEPDAMEKTAIRSHMYTKTTHKQTFIKKHKVTCVSANFYS